MANDNELENVPDGDPVGNTGGSPPTGFQLNELAIWLISLIVFIVPYVVVFTKVFNWDSSFGEMSLFLTYVGFLVSPLSAAVMQLKKRKLCISLIIFILIVAFMSIYCRYEGGDVPFALKVINTISLGITVAMSLTVYILIYKQTKKNKSDVTG